METTTANLRLHLDNPGPHGKKRRATVLVLTAVPMAAGGCSSQQPLMPMPDVYALGLEEP